MDATFLLSAAATTLSSAASADDNNHVPCGRHRGEIKAKKDDENEDGKSNQCNKGELGRGSRSSRYRHLQKWQQCSKYYCVLFRVMKMLKIAMDMLLSSSSSSSPPTVWLVLLLLSQCSFGGGGVVVEAVTVERGLQQQQQQHYRHHQHHHQNNHHANWYSANSRNSVEGRRDGDGVEAGGSGRMSAYEAVRSINGRHTTGKVSAGASQLRGLDSIVNRLEGRGPAGGEGGRRERRDYNLGSDSSRGGDRRNQEGIVQQEEEEDHHHHHRQQSPILPSSTTTHATTTLKHRHPPPAPRGHHQANLNVNTNEEEDDAGKFATKNQEISSNDHVEHDEHDEEDYDEDDDDDNYDDDDELLNTEDDKMSQWAESYKSRYLAGKSTSVATTTSTTPVPPTITPTLTHSQWKWQHLGTRQGLEQYRRHVMAANNNGKNKSGNSNNNSGLQSPHYRPQRGHHGNHGRSSSSSSSNNNFSEPASRALISEAIRHARQVKEEAECKVPRPRVVHVQDLYPHPSKSYVPHCTILHQCSDDTGCCRQQTETCAPKNTHRVELPFYTISLDQSREPFVERLVFYNHTECECRDKMDVMMPRDQEYSLPEEESPSSSPPKLDSITNLVKVDDRDKKKFSLCKCPSAFSKRPLPGDACSCDCFDGQMDCLHLKRGRDFFSLSDKWCIQSGRCEVPECAFGPYIHLIGRCSQKHDFDGDSTSWTKYLSS